MKSTMQTMAEVFQAMQSMMMSNVSTGQAATGSVVMEGPKKQSRRGSSQNWGIVRVPLEGMVL